MIRRRRKIFCKWIFDVVENVVGSYKGKPKPDDLVASKGRKNTDSVGNDSDNVQHDSKFSKILHLTLDIEWEDGVVPGGIGTFPVGSRCLTDPFLVQRYFVQRL